MKLPLLSVAMIVKNEVRNLPGCLDAIRSLGDLVSEICVYDTGSDDNTVALARGLGCRVELGYWDDDFARARQAAASMTSSEWVLSIDADEHIAADASRLRDLLLEGSRRGWDCMTLTIVDQRGGYEVQTHLAHRLFRPHHAHWAGRVHEHLVSSAGRPDPVSIVPAREVVELVHHGYGDADLLQVKHRRNLALAETAAGEAVRAGEREVLLTALVDGARSRLALGDEERAVKDLERVRRMTSQRTYRTFGLELLSDILINQGQYEQALEVVAQLRDEGVSDPSYCVWLEARACAAQGDVHRSLALLRGIDTLRTSLGVTAHPHHLLEARLKAAVAVGEHVEGAACLITLMAAEGIVHRKHGDLLLKLTRGMPARTLVQLLLERDRGHLGAVAEELSLSVHPGPAIANQLRRHLRGTDVPRPGRPSTPPPVTT